MPKIEQRYLDCSIYLYESENAAMAGEDFGGSGCLVAVYSERWGEPRIETNRRLHSQRIERDRIITPPHIYAVTNTHVIQHGCPVVRLNTVGGNADVLNLEEGDWIFHPDGDDLAVAPIDLARQRHKYYPVSDSLFLEEGNVTSLRSSSIGAGDDTFMVGRFINHSGEQRNTPSLRFGSIAMLPFEKIKLEGGHLQEAFLVEMRSISGYSGSPVFVYHPATATVQSAKTSFDLSSNWGGDGQRAISGLVGPIRLLGIDCGHVLNREEVTRLGKPHPDGWHVESNTGMAIVIPAWRLKTLLDMEELKMQRKQKDDEHIEEQEKGSRVAFDIKKPEKPFTKETYEDALKRASSRVSEPESENKK